MRKIQFAILILFIFNSCAIKKNTLLIPANSNLKIEYENYGDYIATIKNKSKSELTIAVVNIEKNKKTKGFGLGFNGKEKVTVAKKHDLHLRNSINKTIKVILSIEKIKKKETRQRASTVDLILQNKSLKSIPLIIPNVMNPNLSPLSKSGVNLRIGQKIFFKQKGKKYLLLEIDNSLKENTIIDICTILKERKQVLGLK